MSLATEKRSRDRTIAPSDLNAYAKAFLEQFDRYQHERHPEYVQSRQQLREARELILCIADTRERREFLVDVLGARAIFADSRKPNTLEGAHHLAYIAQQERCALPTAIHELNYPISPSDREESAFARADSQPITKILLQALQEAGIEKFYIAKESQRVEGATGSMVFVMPPPIAKVVVVNNHRAEIFIIHHLKPTPKKAPKDWEQYIQEPDRLLELSRQKPELVTMVDGSGDDLAKLLEVELVGRLSREGMEEIDKPIVILQESMYRRGTMEKAPVLDGLLNRAHLPHSVLTESDKVERKSGYMLYCIPSLRKMVLIADRYSSAIIVLHRMKDAEDWQNFIGRDLRQLHMLEAVGLASFIECKGKPETWGQKLNETLTMTHAQELDSLDIESILASEPKPVPDDYFTKHEIEVMLAERMGWKRFGSAFAALMQDKTLIDRSNDQPLFGCFIERHRPRVGLHYHKDVVTALERAIPVPIKVERARRLTADEICAALEQDSDILALISQGVKFTREKVRAVMAGLEDADPNIVFRGAGKFHETITVYDEIGLARAKQEIIEYLRAQPPLRYRQPEVMDATLSALHEKLRGPRTVSEIKDALQTHETKINDILGKIALERGVDKDSFFTMKPDANGQKRPHLDPDIILEIQRRIWRYPTAEKGDASRNQLINEGYTAGEITKAQLILSSLPEWSGRELGVMKRNNRGHEVWMFHASAAAAIREIIDAIHASAAK
jgi:hypothetical protein